MSKIDFSYTQTDLFGKTEKTYNMSTNSLTLQHILEDFELFLRGAGFIFDGMVDIVDTNEISPEPEGYELTDDMVKVIAEQHSASYFDVERNK